MRDILEPLRIALGDTTAFGLAVVLTAGDCRKAISEIEQLRQRIAALEAEKAERDAQEPVAWAWNDALGCMHAHDDAAIRELIVAIQSYREAIRRALEAWDTTTNSKSHDGRLWQCMEELRMEIEK